MTGVPAPTPLSNSTTLPSPNSDASLIVSLISNFTISSIVCCVFLFLRFFCYSSYILHPMAPSEKKLLSWIYHLVVFKWENFYKSHGLDALIYLRFLSGLSKIAMFILMYAIVVTLPVYITASRKYLNADDPMYITGTATMTMSNINPDSDSDRYWATVLSVYFNSLVCYYFLFKVYKTFHKYRMKHKSTTTTQNLTVRITNVPLDLTEQQIYDKLNKIFPDKIWAIKRIPEIAELDDMFKQKKKWVLDRARVKAMYIDRNPAATCMLFIFFRISRNSVYQLINNYNHLISQVNQKIISAQQQVDSYLPTPVLYVTFKDLLSARICAQSALDKQPFAWKTSHAPEEDDIIWENHHLTHLQKKLLFYGITVIVWLLIVFWAIPVGFASSVANLKVLGDILGYKAHFERTAIENPKIISLVEGLLPSVVIWIFYLILMPLLRFLTVHQGHLTNSQVEEYTLRKFFGFVIVNVFLTSLLAGTAFDVWQQLVSFTANPPELLPLVASAIPNQVNFFIGYTLLSSVFAYSIQLLRPWWIFIRGVTLCCYAYSPEEIDEANKSEEFDYSYYYGMHLLFFLIVLTYSSIAPLVIPFGIIYFAFAYFVHMHNMTYVTKQSFEGFGNLWPSVFTKSCVVLGMYQMVLMTLLGMNKFYWSFLVGPAIGITYAYWHHLNKNFTELCFHGPLDLDLEKEERRDTDPQFAEAVKTAYLPPCLIPPAADEGIIVPNELSADEEGTEGMINLTTEDLE